MRSIAIAILLVVCACDDHDKGACVYGGTSHTLGDVFPAGDGCNSCECTTTGSSCTLALCNDGGVDANPLSCGPSGGCPSGPACGTICCKHGEHCVDGACQCGSKPGCGSGDTCERAGPVGGDFCGTLCCGLHGPCPL